MKTDTIIRRLSELGVSLSLNGEVLEMRPGSKVPHDLKEEVRSHKADLIGRLVPYTPSDSELVEIERQVYGQGYVLLWSTILTDTVAFVQTDADRQHIPPGFTVYTLDELTTLFGDKAPSPDSLRLIHQGKRFGGNVIDGA